MIQGNHVTLVKATQLDKENVYNWCFHSETTKSHSGLPNFPNISIPSYEEFCESYYDDSYFSDSKPNEGMGFIIKHHELPIGFVSYASSHLKPGISELDIWMNSEAHCGKGFGADAINTLSNYLHDRFGINTFIMGPSEKNTRAIKAYNKAGFALTNNLMSDFLLDAFVELFGGGDYGVDGTAVLVKKL